MTDNSLLADMPRAELKHMVPKLQPTAHMSDNSLLAALPRADLQRMAPKLQPVTLTFGDLLYEPLEAIRHVYFPQTSLVSLLTLADGHQAVEVGVVGWEGMVGIPLVLESNVSVARAIVQGTGTAMRMRTLHFRKALAESETLRRLLHRYVFGLMAQISQTAACNRFHVVEARLARWLLMSQDRLRVDQFRMTHEFLGQMLGARRVGVTTAAQVLQKANLIGYSRGEITIYDRPGLEAAACGCYAVVKALAEGNIKKARNGVAVSGQ